MHYQKYTRKLSLYAIVLSIGSVGYETAKYLSGIPSALTGNTKHHSQNPENFVNKTRDIYVKNEEILVVFDVSALFTSVPVNESLDKLKKKTQ